jgi:hypothetical protein
MILPRLISILSHGSMSALLVPSILLRHGMRTLQFSFYTSPHPFSLITKLTIVSGPARDMAVQQEPRDAAEAALPNPCNNKLTSLVKGDKLILLSRGQA